MWWRSVQVTSRETALGRQECKPPQAQGRQRGHRDCDSLWPTKVTSRKWKVVILFNKGPEHNLTVPHRGPRELRGQCALTPFRRMKQVYAGWCEQLPKVYLKHAFKKSTKYFCLSNHLHAKTCTNQYISICIRRKNFPKEVSNDFQKGEENDDSAGAETH